MTASIIVGIITGVISSLIASVLFLHHIKRKLPDIKISEEIITDTDPETNQHSLAIKFINNSKNSLVDVTVTLYGDRYQNKEKSLVTYHQLSKKVIPFVHCYDESDNNCHYAIIATMPLEDGIDKLQEEFHAISVKIIGKDALYGTYASVSQCYESSSIKNNSIFELCNNTNTRQLPPKKERTITKKGDVTF